MAFHSVQISNYWPVGFWHIRYWVPRYWPLRITSEPDATVYVGADDRTLDVAGEGRVIYVGEDDRTLDV